jgi:TfoX/Sxy family transcriptional regulator of competence genes
LKWKPAPPEMVKLFEVATQAVPQAEKRKMFGYPAVFANGHMFAGLHQDSFVLKLPAPDYAAFLKLEGAKPFEPMPGRPMTGFVAVPQAMVQSPELGTWLKKALSFAESQPPKTPRSKGTK